jgi:hypothetical protein
VQVRFPDEVIYKLLGFLFFLRLIANQEISEYFPVMARYAERMKAGIRMEAGRH